MWQSPTLKYPETEGLQISDHRLSTSRGVVKRPDQHCGDDLVCAVELKICTQFSVDPKGMKTIEWQQRMIILCNVFGWWA